MDINERIKQYLQAGGLHNPELMEHIKVRDMIIDAQKEIETLRKDREKLVEALRFYADRFSWEWSRHPELEQYSAEIKNDSSLVKYKERNGEEYQNHCGGKLARATLKELGELE